MKWVKFVVVKKKIMGIKEVIESYFISMNLHTQK
jgi:hypothetical protein